MNIKDPLLNQVAQRQLARVPAPLQQAVQRAIGAGERIMYAQQTRKLLLKQLSQPGPKENAAAEGIAKLCILIYRQSGGKLPYRALIPAGSVLVCEALQFLLDSGAIPQITNEVVQEAVKEFASSFLQLLGVTPDRLQALMAQAPQQAQSPQAAQPGA